jgi:hypothetical protein
VQTQVCLTCGDSFFTQVGLAEHVRLGQHNQTVRLWVGGVSPALRENGLRVAQLNNSRRRRCDGCGLVSTPAAVGIHQKFTGHTGWAEA